MRFFNSRAALAACALFASGVAHAAAWPAPEGELVLTTTGLGDIYDEYSLISTNRKLLEEPQGSVVQVGPVRRYGFLLTAEYGVTDKATVNLTAGYFHTQHLEVGDNVRAFTNAQPNTQTGLQDLAGNVKFLLWQHQGDVILGLSPNIGFQFPLAEYDTTVNNPIGDGIIQLDLALAFSAAVPSAGLFFNADAIYKVREKKKFGSVTIHDQVQALGEVGYFLHPKVSVRALVKYYESLGGIDLSFATDPGQNVQGGDQMQLYTNPLVFDQDALFVGGGPYVQINDYVGVGLTYVQAVWFRNHANLKTVGLSISFNPHIKAQEPLPEEYLPVEEAPPAEGEAPPTTAPMAPAPSSAPSK